MTGYEYGVYTENDCAPVHVKSLNDLGQAQRIAKDIARNGKTESFVYNFWTYEVEYRVRGQYQNA
jgi:hypothetical protein